MSAGFTPPSGHEDMTGAAGAAFAGAAFVGAPAGACPAPCASKIAGAVTIDEINRNFFMVI